MLNGGALAATRSGPVNAAASDSRAGYRKLVVAVSTTVFLLLLAGFLHHEPVATYDLAHVPAGLLQMVHDTPLQPLFLVIALLPIYVAGARHAPWVAIVGGGLMMISLALPYSRFPVVDLSPQSGFSLSGSHNSLFQLAGPGNQMPQAVSIVTLLLTSGVIALPWGPQVGGLIGLIGVITMVFVWLAAVAFFSRSLLPGYCLAWAGGVICTGSEWVWSHARRPRCPRSLDSNSGMIGALG